MARGKSWRKEEDLSLVRAIVRVLQDAGTLERGAIAFWARVTSLYEELLADEHAPPRTPGAVESRWKNLQASVAGFVKCLASASRGGATAALPETERINAAMKLYHEKDPKKNAFENLEVWECLRKEMPLYEDFVSSSTSFYMMQKKREGGLVVEDAPGAGGGADSNKKKRMSMSVYDAEAALLGRDTSPTPTAAASPATAANTNGARSTTRRALAAEEPSHEDQRATPAAASPRQSPLRPTAAHTAPATTPAPATTSAPAATRETAETLQQKAKYWKAMQEAAETRNTLLAEQNAIAAEKNMIMLFASRDDAVSTEFFDLKRRIALAKLKRDFADFLR